MSAVSNTEVTSEPGSSRSTSPFDPSPALVEAYQTLLDSRFDGLLPTQPLQANEADSEDENEGKTGNRAMTKAEKQNAKKKRRKERERLAKQQQQQQQHVGGVAFGRAGPNADRQDTIEFRLFSSCPIRPINVTRPEEVYPLPTNPRYDNYSDDELSRRRQLAAQAAVFWPELGGPSALAQRWTRTDRPTRKVRQTCDSTRDIPILPNLVIGAIQSERTRRTQSGAESERDGVLRLIEKEPKRGVRRGRKKRKVRPVAGYWTPERGGVVGGKSQMTMWARGIGMPVPFERDRANKQSRK